MGPETSRKKIALRFYNCAFPGDWPPPGTGLAYSREATEADKTKLVALLEEWFSPWMARYKWALSLDAVGNFLTNEFYTTKALVESLAQRTIYPVDIATLNMLAGTLFPAPSIGVPVTTIEIRGLPPISWTDSFLPISWPPRNPVVSACEKLPRKALARQASCSPSTVDRAYKGKQIRLPDPLARCVASVLDAPRRVIQLDYALWRSRATVDYTPPPPFHPGSQPEYRGYGGWLLASAALHIHAGLVELLNDPRIVKCHLSECGRAVVPKPRSHGQLYCTPRHQKRAFYLGENRAG